MKFNKTLLIGSLLTLCMAFAVNAQDKKASLGIGFGGAAASAKGVDGIKNSGFGLNFFINGMYNVNENISAGLEYNANIVVLGDVAGASVSATQINGVLVKGRYFFGSGNARPFAGVMMGIYNIQPGEVSGSTSLAILFEKKTVFGFAPEVGVSIGSFQLATSYHLPGKYKGEVVLPSIGTQTFEETYTVWQFNIGWNIGLMDN
jgi:hypothetical protein